ncbi:dihydroxyacetone kinase subunit L [Thalassobacillus devorans]|uniref:Dihydroxyacetone kinase subunit L n=1 Tax=Thalassobacillus devorans TaxID=279813 RepID=A0ABQ1NVE4_9BACI|nr:dihydroxyacetone kinase subunit DhaL [Thalassobacillus devorans]NIK28700.1 dihydroxyacetone kinase-like protein [Thalassobacillus devorans]GGC84221.1 dihydroxyacetone kinase subunit L [Thalassobacillus devorans]
MTFTVEQAINWLTKSNEKIQKNKDYLSELDQAIGDGDHGINMARGFDEVVKKLDGNDYEQVADVLKDAAMTLMSKVGGASGPLFGTAFLKISMAVKGEEAVTFGTFVKALEDAVAGVKQRGKAEEGEKTMIDVWSPMVERMKAADDFDASVIRDNAKSSMEATKDIVATKGRAAYLKERSKGHLDPGSVSSYYIFEALAESLEEGA